MTGEPASVSKTRFWRDDPSTTEPDDAPPPSRIGRYVVERVLGEGSFGVVYLAHDDQLNRPVALKVPHRKALTPDGAAAYLEEARTAARLDHPGIVPVYDVGSTEQIGCYIVQKYVEGVTLRELVEQRRPSHRSAAELAVSVAEALHYAHTQGVVHRDVKPGNVLIDPSGRPLLADFGLALHEHASGAASRFAGTAAYMSPEQARGEGHRVDGRTDVFSLGVVLYELLVGRRPFRAASETALLEQIVFSEPIPPRQVDDSIPRELERICLKALSKRVADRYTTAKDLADDLSFSLDTGEPDGERLRRARESASRDEFSGASSTAAARLGDGEPIYVVPRGLYPFDFHDSDFFLSLLPGTRDRNGLPESVRFWKAKADENDVSRTFAVGVLYGPSGSGKSSLLRAGLLPRLGSHAVPVYVEATPAQTESRLLSALKRRFPTLSDAPDLSRLLAELRVGRGMAAGSKVFIVLDQFEQWLLKRHDHGREALVRALRQCDGERVQCLIAVRDEFWMGVTRFMQALEIPLVEGSNAAAVDLFSERHARSVLAAFGRAYGALGSPASGDQDAFLDEAVAGLGENGRIVCVRLSMFAEMMKDRPWTPAALTAAGGTEGLGVRFLEDSLGGTPAAPERRHHERAARSILAALLPEPGVVIRGHMRSAEELAAAAGYASDPARFDEVTRILDRELHLITPVDPEGRDVARSTGDESQPGYYQLAHDYLVPPLQAWLTLRQRETRRGRAALRLSELAELWASRPTRRSLPDAGEFLFIRWHSDPRRWTDRERRLMQAAVRRHAKRWSAAAAGFVCLVAAVLAAVSHRERAADRRIAESHVSRLLDAPVADVPQVLRDLRPYQGLIEPRLRAVASDAELPQGQRIRAGLALLPGDGTSIERLQSHLYEGSAEEVLMLTRALAPHLDRFRDELWQALESKRGTDPARALRAALALAQLEKDDPRWTEVAPWVAGRLASDLRLRATLGDWRAGFRPVRAALVAPLTAYAIDEGRTESERLSAASLLADYADAPAILAGLVVSSDPAAFGVYLDKLASRGDKVRPYLRDVLDEPAAPVAPKAELRWPMPGPSVVAAVEEAQGTVADRFAYCLRLPAARFEETARSLMPVGYRPVCVRPFASTDGTQLGVVWSRDGRKWRFRTELTAEAAAADDEEARREGLFPYDLAVVPAGDSTEINMSGFSVLWGEPTGDLIDAKMYAGVPEKAHRQQWEALNAARYVPRRNVKSVDDVGTALYSSVRWKLRTAPVYWDAWSMLPAEYTARTAAGWCQMDVEHYPSGPDGREDARYAAVWWNGTATESRRLERLPADAHSSQGRRLAAEGFVPVAISVSESPDGVVLVDSVWHRQAATDDQLDAAARRRANAAAALLLLGDTAPAWRILGDGANPRERTYLIHHFAGYGVAPETLSARLKECRSAVERQALLMALAEFPESQMPDELRRTADEWLLPVWQTDPSSGVHSTAERLLRLWGLEALVAAGRSELPQNPPSAGPGWYVDGHGHMLAVVDGPTEFSMGSPGWERERDHHAEVTHLRRIPRRFAIATCEVTVDQFLAFDPDFDYAYDFSPTVDCPVNMVTWYDAARYCRWLSEREGFAEDEMCYPPLDEIRSGMTLPADMLSRTGYRLPTEAEWEYACRADTVSPRFYGYAPDLLPAYGWNVDNSEYRSRPVGQLHPNPLGLFDLYGNAMEWCNDRDAPYSHDMGVPTIDDLTTSDRTVSDGQYRRLRGGVFLYVPTNARSAQRHQNVVDRRQPFVAFRVARTLR